MLDLQNMLVNSQVARLQADRDHLRQVEQAHSHQAKPTFKATLTHPVATLFKSRTTAVKLK